MKSIFWKSEKFACTSIKSGKYKTNDPYLAATLGFCQKWLNGQQQFEWLTSGSTGTPKKIVVSRAQMEASAHMTIAHLGLGNQDHAFVCLNTAYIAGAMMLVRAMEAGMDMTIAPPAADPFEGCQVANFTFAAMVPMQLQTILSGPATSAKKLDALKKVLVGGSAVSKPLEAQLAQLSPDIYATYGMTETVSHIALRKIGHDAHYQILDSTLELGLDARSCLTIKGAVTAHQTLVTNDLVVFHTPHTFEWLGRYDRVINTGGVKVQAEQVEATASAVLQSWGISADIAVIGLPDETLGQRVTLVVENGNMDEGRAQALQKQLKAELPPYHGPRQVLHLNNFPRTPNGKIDRMKLIEKFSALG